MRYPGIVTRSLALLVDLAIINAILLVCSVAIGAFIAAIVPGHQTIDTPAILATAGASLVFTAVYLVGFWVLVGHTPGMRALGIELTCAEGERLTLRRGIRRLGGFVLTALTLGLGALLILFDDRRRTLQDMLADTVVTRPG